MEAEEQSGRDGLGAEQDAPALSTGTSAKPSDTSEKQKTSKRSLADRVTDPFSRKRTPEEEQAEDVAFAKFVVGAMSIPESARFYNLPEANANYRFWARCPWSADDAVALSFGKDPRQVDRHKLANYIPIWPFAREYWERLKQVRVLLAERDWVVLAPTHFVVWAEEMGIALPADLLRAVEETKRAPEPDPEMTIEISTLRKHVSDLEAEVASLRDAKESLERDLSKERGENPKSLRTYEKLVFALAVKFRFTPDQRNSAAANVRTLLLNEGVTIDQGIVRERLEHAWRCFREDDMPD